MILRSETPADFNQIARINYTAFSNWRPENFNVDEHVMVALARQLACFDPELSIVAEDKGQLIGHIMLVPVNAIVLGEEIQGVMLGPVAVLPERQNTGVGKQLIAEAHKRASEKSYAFSLLCGHPSYYPKFGYLQNIFSISGTKVIFDTAGICIDGMQEKPISPGDIEALHHIQFKQAMGSTFSFIKQEDFVDWCSHTPPFRTFTIIYDGAPAAYVRFGKDKPSYIREMYVKEGLMANVLAYLINTYIKDTDDSEISLHIPYDIIKKELGDRAEITDVRHPSDAFMICPLNGSSKINDYCSGVQSGQIQPGIVCYPAWIDMA